MPQISILYDYGICDLIKLILCEFAFKFLSYFPKHAAFNSSCSISNFDGLQRRLNSLFIDECFDWVDEEDSC